MSYLINEVGENTDGPPTNNTRWGDRIGLLPVPSLMTFQSFPAESVSSGAALKSAKAMTGGFAA